MVHVFDSNLNGFETRLVRRARGLGDARSPTTTSGRQGSRCELRGSAARSVPSLAANGNKGVEQRTASRPLSSAISLEIGGLPDGRDKAETETKERRRRLNRRQLEVERRRSEPVEVRPETVRGSGKKAARLDLESAHPLGDQTAYQDGLVAAHGEASSNELEHAATERGELEEELADVECELGWREAGVEDGNAKIAKAERRRDSIAEAARLIGQMSLVAYVALMVLFSVAEYPLLKLSFTRLPVDDRTIRLISVLVGMMLVASVHVLGQVASARRAR